MTDPVAAQELNLTYAKAAELAFRWHADRRFVESETIYRELLKVAPGDQNVIHYLGVLLHQTGRHAEAVQLIERSLAADDRVAAWHNNYGNVLLDASRFDEAAAAYQRCVELDPGNVEVLCNLGVMYRGLNKLDDAEAMLNKAIAAQPDFPDAYHNLARVYWQMGRFEEAYSRIVAALNVYPRNPNIRRMLAAVYGLMGRVDDAAGVYREWLELEPGNRAARHHLAGCTGVDVPEQADDGYVEELFNSFANSFDAKLAALDYRAPQLVAEAVSRLLPIVAADLRVLDAGCGTGLCGPYLASRARELIGVDLSANMIELARARSVYTGFAKGELVAYLDRVAVPFDVIVSADTLCYFGRLDRVAHAARQALRTGGLLIFTVEARTEGGRAYELHAHGRYSHRADYVRATLEEGGFAVRQITEVVLRSEGGRPVSGLLIEAEARELPAARG
jgi:predicted TPR repeat methyltransferase